MISGSNDDDIIFSHSSYLSPEQKRALQDDLSREDIACGGHRMGLPDDGVTASRVNDVSTAGYPMDYRPAPRLLTRMKRQLLISAALIAALGFSSQPYAQRKKDDEEPTVPLPPEGGIPLHVPKSLYDMGVNEQMEHSLAKSLVGIYHHKRHIETGARLAATDVPYEIADAVNAGHVVGIHNVVDGSFQRWDGSNAWDTVSSSRQRFAGLIKETVADIGDRYQTLAPKLKAFVDDAKRLAENVTIDTRVEQYLRQKV